MQATKLIPSILKRTVRNFLYHPSGIEIGVDSFVERPFKVSSSKAINIGNQSRILPNSRILAIERYGSQRFSPEITIGESVYLGAYLFLAAIDRVTIGDGVVISDFAYLSDSLHGIDPRAGLIMQQDLRSTGPISIGQNCFLGYRVAVMPGVTLGEHCVVGTNSVVTKSFPAFSMIAGSPAVLVKRYCPERGEWVRVS
jgi:acetyltransferase-like isoleucine patch superfamily enzyme